VESGASSGDRLANSKGNDLESAIVPLLDTVATTGEIVVGCDGVWRVDGQLRVVAGGASWLLSAASLVARRTEPRRRSTIGILGTLVRYM